jgi:hypothetical protein
MNTKALPFLTILLLSVSLVFGQSADSTKVKRIDFGTYDELRTRQKGLGIDSLTYVDSTFNYIVQIPGWLHLRTTGSPNMIGGTLPAINGIENAIMIKGFSKSEFKSFEEFKEIYLTGNKFGEPTKFSREHIWYGQNPLIKIDNGVKQKVFTYWRNKIYHNLFTLLETKSAYLWIQFTSTPDTYDLNISKFDQFMSGFKISNF